MSIARRRAKMEKLARKRRRKQEARARRQGKRSPFFGGGSSCLFGPVGGVKMSDVLEAFVEPYSGFVNDVEAFRRLLTVGVLAWNAALMPEARGQRLVDDVIRKGEFGMEDEASCRQLVRELVHRKRTCFADYCRPILNFAVEDDGDSYHLTVLSAVV